MQITITDIRKLKAALICAAKKDVRYCLNGVLVEVHAKHILLVSTDGHRLSIIRSTFDADHKAIGHKFIIPREMIERYLNAADKGIITAIHFEPSEKDGVEGYEISIQDNLGSLVIDGRAIDGKFPDWLMIYGTQSEIPLEVRVFSANHSYIADFGKIAEILGCRKANVHVQFLEVSPGMYKVDIGNEDFSGILMGIRDRQYTDTSWVK